MKILCATDLLPKSELAIDRAGKLAERLEADLSLVHVVAAEGSGQDAGRLFARLSSRARPPLWQHGPQPNVILRRGSPGKCVIEEADQLRANLVVLGARRRRSANAILRDTIAEQLLSARCSPVLIVRGQPHAGYSKVLLALDLSSVSAAAVRAAEALMLEPSSSAVVVHAHEEPYSGMLVQAGLRETVARYHTGWEQEARAAITDLLTAQSDDFTRYEILLQRKRPDTAIQHTLRKVRPDLLVMGTRGHGRIRRMLIGSVANLLLHRTKCDVLIVPAGSLSCGAPRRMRLKPVRDEGDVTASLRA